MKASNLLPRRLRRPMLALAEMGHETNRDLKLALLPRRRSLFLDVGANRGQFARFVSPFYDRVVVFEPIERFAGELRAVLAANAVVEPCALADFAGTATFYVPADEDPATTQTASLLRPASTTGHVETEVRVARLDDFAFDDVAFVKVDIEGAEYAFLKGASATLERCRPVLLIEIEDRHTKGDSMRVFELLAGFGYRAFIPSEPAAALRSSALSRLLRGAAYLSGAKRIALTPIDRMLDGIRSAPGSLNTSFGDRYVNNFLFLP